MHTKIVVTGIGIITSIGKNPVETFDSLTNYRSGIKPLSILDTIHKDKFVAGEIKLTHDELISLADVSPDEPWTRTALLAVIAARQASNDARLSENEALKTGLVSATTVGGMDRSELFYKDFLNKDEPNIFIDTHHAGNATEKVAETLNIDEFITTISTACSSSLNSIMFGARLIKNGLLDQVIVGGTDALSKFTINGFNTLMILDKHVCRPFDASRTGLNLGEGAAYLVLEREDIAISQNKNIYAEVSGFANANDAFHQTASSEDGTGPYLAMEGALKYAELSPDEIGYINVHGTGTDNNDLTEGRALSKLFGTAPPPFSSTKAYTGHTLGAAGVVEAIFAIMALNNGIIFPNLNFQNKIEELDIRPEKELLKKQLNHVMTNSFGFGGNDSSVVFSKWDDSRLQTQDSRPKTPGPRLQTPVYINGIGSVAPVETLDNITFLDQIEAVNENYLQVLKPNYREYINPKVLRRMSNIVRMGIVAAKTAMNDAGIDQPDAIITGTGMGCQADTEKFLNAMLDNNESLLTPTSFIQSTHNTIGAQIALMLGNHNYNFTYVHRTFSFESALLDSLLQIQENRSNQILLGGVDEITEESWLIKTRLDYFRKTATNNLSLLKNKEVGALAGESASFFVLSPEKTAKTYAKIVGVENLFRPSSISVVSNKITSFLEKFNLSQNDIDLVLLGYNGDQKFDPIYQRIEEQLFSDSNIGYFKHLCGEHDTASAFAFWIASRILKQGNTPDILIKEKRSDKKPKCILIYNHFRNINHSLILLEKV